MRFSRFLVLINHQLLAIFLQHFHTLQKYLCQQVATLGVLVEILVRAEDQDAGDEEQHAQRVTDHGARRPGSPLSGARDARAWLGVHPENPILVESRPLIEADPQPWSGPAGRWHGHEGPRRRR